MIALLPIISLEKAGECFPPEIYEQVYTPGEYD